MRWWDVALYVEEGDAELDNLEQINVAANCLVVIRGFGVEVSDGSRDNTGELGVLFRK
jgi:hypothetical protein